MNSLKARRGFTLIELLIYIVVCSIAMTGILALYQNTAAKSSNALLGQRALEAARAELERMEALPAQRAMETAGAQSADSLSDWAGGAARAASPPKDALGRPFPGLEGHRLETLVRPAPELAPAGEAFRIDVSVIGPEGRQTLTGYAFRRGAPKLGQALARGAP